jgi:hypothetical protein
MSLDAPPRVKRSSCWPDQVIERMRERRTYRVLSEYPYSRAKAYEDLDHWGRITLICQDEETRRRIEQDRADIDEAWQDLYHDRRAGIVAMLLEPEPAQRSYE